MDLHQNNAIGLHKGVPLKCPSIMPAITFPESLSRIVCLAAMPPGSARIYECMNAFWSSLCQVPLRLSPMTSPHQWLVQRCESTTGTEIWHRTKTVHARVPKPGDDWLRGGRRRCGQQFSVHDWQGQGLGVESWRMRLCGLCGD